MLRWSLTTVAVLLAVAVVISFVHPIKLSGGSGERYELGHGGIARIHGYNLTGNVTGRCPECGARI